MKSMNNTRLYLVQHGEAVSETINPDRPLTEKGRLDSARTAGFLKTSGMTVDVIWHSSKTRARETAAIFQNELLSKEGIVQKEGFSPNDPVGPVFDEIGHAQKNIMIVGHLPFLQKLASLALINSEAYEIIKFSMGGVVCLERNEEGKWQLIFEIIPELLR